MRIIGIELRVMGYTASGPERKEIAVIPCDVTVEVEQGHGQFFMNGTLHTEEGDIQIQDFPIPTPFRRLTAIRNVQK